MSKRIGIKEYYVLGWYLTKIDPERAKEIITTYSQPEPQYHDYSLIPIFFESFCEVLNIEPESVRGSLFKTSMVDLRKKFISVMIRLYNPQLYQHPKNCLLIRRGLSKYLAVFLGLNKSNTSRAIKECIMEERIYEEVKVNVSEIIQAMNLKTVEKKIL